MVVDERKQLLITWLQGVFGTDKFSCEPASSDASFRRYFRVILADESFVVMDAPPEKEDCTSFITIATLLFEQGINVPKIFHLSLEKGFLVLSDLGSENYLDDLNDETADKRYDDAVQALHKMHRLPTSELDIPMYDSGLLQQEMGLFDEWFVSRLLGVELSVADKQTLASVKSLLSESALAQPQVFVHRDYHSRNLMLTTKNNPGVIDFQDAVIGPITYDLVSLYRDCYIEWADEKIYTWLDEFIRQRKKQGHADEFDRAQFYQWFDWMGVQRHLKVLGIFSRLCLRDGKPGYLNDIPLTLSYVINVCRRYKALEPLAELMERHDIANKFEQRQTK
ncbi:MAG TPA: phosphotransferase [Cycloclasticus sp.]|jgi:aminoglycoside/choline kinase family phosphotransferase|nr:phosphotransferase [Cycloclasticus sp.]HIL92751.1 phosphotransferase [Cycloclasticus sp.]